MTATTELTPSLNAASHRTDIVKLPLPSGVKPGMLVGRGGHNCRWLHYNSGGAHINVNDTAISIRSHDSNARRKAVQLVRRQLEAMARLAMHENAAPTRVDYILLESAFGADPRVRFSRRNDEVAAATGLKDRLFVLAPKPDPTAVGPDGVDTEVECPGGPRPEQGGSHSASSSFSSPSFSSTSSFSSSSSSSSSQSQRDQDAVRDQDLRAQDWDRRSSSGGDYPVEGAARFHAASATAATWAGAGPTRCGGGDWALLACAGRALAAGAHKAACCEPSYDVIKIRFKLGKSLFRNPGPRAGRAELSVADLEGASGGRGAYQSVFSNFVPAFAVPRVTSWLTGCLGFSLVDTKTSATLHVINQELNVHYSISLSMDRGDDSTASLRKLKAGGSKSHSVTLMAAPEQMDLRLKLIAQFREHPSLAYDTDAYSTARRVAAAVRTEGFDGFTRSKRGLPRNRHLEYARRKTKFVYEGCFPMQQQEQQGGGGCGQRLRVSVTQVQDDKGTHYEISGCLPEIDAALRQTLAEKQRPAAAPDCSVPEWRRRGRSSGGVGSMYDSASSSPARTPLRSTTPDPDSRWALGALATLTVFVSELNSNIAQVLSAAAPPPPPPRQQLQQQQEQRSLERDTSP